MKMKLYVGLIHHPVIDKKGDTVTTSVTNLDIHDIARSCRTFGVSKYFIITPLILQHQLVDRILTHWRKEDSREYNPYRHEALGLVQLAHSIAQVKERIRGEEDGPDSYPLSVVTGARLAQHDGGVGELQKKMHVDKRPILLLFGTGWGLHPSVIEDADFRLAPIGGCQKKQGEQSYNHLSVRSAVAIYLYRFQTDEEDRIGVDRKG